MAQTTSANFWQWREDTWLHKRLAEKRDELKATSKSTTKRDGIACSRTSQIADDYGRDSQLERPFFERELMAGPINASALQSHSRFSGKPARDRDSD